jgi:dipeptidyl aminopeptidase/acylaminoacyl peptidase
MRDLGANYAKKQKADRFLAAGQPCLRQFRKIAYLTAAFIPKNDMKPVFFALLLALPQAAAAQPLERGNLLLDQVPEIPGELAERLARYQEARGASFADWDPQGGLLISTRFGDVNQIHHVAAPGASRQQLTFFREPLGGAQSCPDPAREAFLYSRDLGGNEQFQLYLFDRRSGASTLLTDGQSRHQSARWSRDGKRIALSCNRRNGADLDIYLLDPARPGVYELAYEGQGGGWGVQDWSPDGSKLLLRNYLSVADSRLYVLDLASRQLREFNPLPQPAALGEAQFAADGKGIYFISDESGEFSQLYYRALEQGSSSLLSRGVEWDVENFDLSRDGRWAVFTANEDGFSRLYLLDLRRRRLEAVGGMPSGVAGGLRFHPDNDRVALSLNSPTSPSDVQVWSRKQGSWTRWTFSETGGIPESRFVAPQLIRYPSFDSAGGQRRMIPALLYLPAGHSGPRPVVISIHGGPEGQSRPSFNPFVQFLAAEMGYAVLLPNVRGSTGYGKTYVGLDNGFLRENSVRDIGALLDWAGTQPGLDARRMAVWGGSYGGYMVLACMTHYSDRLACAVDLFGISNFVSFLQNTSAYRRDLRRAEYGDERDPAMRAHLERISPLSNIAKISKPMFVFQGQNDPRVPQSESEQMVAALRRQGIETWYILARDEGHGLAKKANRDQVYASIALFFGKHLAAAP